MRWPGVARIYYTPSRPGPTHDLIRTDGATVHLNRLPPMQATEEGTFQDAQCTSSLYVKTAETLVFGERIPQRPNPVIGRKSDNIVSTPAHRITRSQLTDRHLERGPLRAQVNQHFEGRLTTYGAIQFEGLHPTL